MSFRRPNRTRRHLARRGAILVLMAAFLPVALILAAFAINLSYMELARTEMYVSTDAATRAAARQLTISQSTGTAKVSARAVAGLNTVAGEPLQLHNNDFDFGMATRTSTATRYNYATGGTTPNAVQIVGKRTAGSLSGPIQLLMPAFLTTSQVEIQEVARSNLVDIDVALVLDRSGSMAYAADEPAVYPPLPAAAPSGWFFCQAAPNPSRWRDLVDGVNEFFSELGNSPGTEQVSLITYSSAATRDQNLTTNYPNIQASIDLYTQAFCSGTTAIGDGIIEGMNSLAGGAARPWASKVILVMTDGLYNAGTDPVTAATTAAGQDILIYTITFSDEADQTLMQNVATIGYGRHYHCTNAAQLRQAFRDIAKSLPVLLTR